MLKRRNKRIQFKDENSREREIGKYKEKLDTWAENRRRTEREANNEEKERVKQKREREGKEGEIE